MYKAKSASMMRGAEKRAKLAPKPRPPSQPNPNAKIAVAELVQFSSATTSRDAFLAQLRPAVQQARQGGYSTPLQIATFLNRNGWRTACGERWDKRLAALLLRLLWDQRREVRKTKSPPPAAPSSSDDVRPKQPLARDEIASRLTAIGRVSSI